MQIQYATTHCWRKEVVQDPLSLFGESERKKIVGTLKKIEEQNVHYVIEPLVEDFFNWWLPMYQERISTKSNPSFFDVKAKTLGNPDKSKKYFSLTLFEGDHKLGGAIFSLKENVLFFAYRTFTHDWKKAPLRAGPSLYVEYVLAKYAREIGAKHISHGKDRNPYGINSSIGLASFKLAAGCRPRLMNSYEIGVLNSDELTTDSLVLECPAHPSPHKEITRAYLIASEVGIEKWRPLSSYPDQLQIEVIARQNLLS